MLKLDCGELFDHFDHGYKFGPVLNGIHQFIQYLKVILISEINNLVLNSLET